MPSEYDENMAFEADVRRAAEAIWRMAPGECQPEHYSSDAVIRELDGMARLRDLTHLLMVTVSRKLDKLKTDVKKLDAAEKIELKRGIPVAKWLITKYQLDAEHVGYARDRNVKVLTLSQFRNRFFDGRKYIQQRRAAAFGSARNLSDGSITISENEYVPLPIVRQSGRLVVGSGAAKGNDDDITVADIASAIIEGARIVLVAPFGSGKSLTLREVFFRIAAPYLKDEDVPVPVAINLRDHWGALYADEILERHARSIAFTPREDIVTAWRAGIAAMLIDGFDEVASQVLAGADKVNFMRQARLEALQATKDLVMNTPSGVGVFVCGRDHYFDDERELVHALGLEGQTYIILRLGEFTESQAMAFVKRHGVQTPLPDWLPRKPLLLGYLAHRKLLPEVFKIESDRGYGYAWDTFLYTICEREAQHGRAVMDPATLRRVLERLAAQVRRTSSGTGPITSVDLAEAYKAETGQPAGEGVLMQLQRLPGLTQREQDPGARSFIDEDLLASLQGSALARFLLERHDASIATGWLDVLSVKGIATAAYLLRKQGADSSTIVSAGLLSADASDSQLQADCFMIAQELAREDGVLDCRGTALDEAVLGDVDLEEIQINGITVTNCAIHEVSLGSRGAASTIRFRDCLIRTVRGVAAASGLPPGMFDSCDIDKFDDVSTNAAVLRSAQSAPMKALLTILRKLYVQAGGGRRVAALKRGIPQQDVLENVDDVLQILASEGLVSITSDIAHPVRRQSARVWRILDQMSVSNDPIVLRVLALDN
jgi:hypothetical protein